MAGLLYRLFWSWEVAVVHVCFGLTLSVLLLQLLFCRFPKIPFTCSYLPGPSRSMFLYPFCFLGLASFAYGAADLEIWLAQNPHRFLCFYGLAAALAIVMTRPAAALVLSLFEAFDGEDKIRFEEQSQVAPIYLDLRN